MCKSADEPGGPYRCSADMRSRLDSATHRLQEARDNAAQTASDANQANAAAQRYASEAADPDRSPADREKLRHLADKAAVDAKAASKANAAATSRYVTATAKWRNARADFDSTPAGLAELQRLSYDADATGDHSVQASAHERTSAALDTMTAEAQERSRKWGSTPTTYLAPRVGSTTSGPTPHLDNGALTTPMTGMDHGAAEGGGRKRTYVFHPEGRSAVKVHMVDADTDSSDETSVVGRMVAGARKVAGHTRFIEHCRARGVDRRNPVVVEKARTEWTQGRHYDAQGIKAFGEDKWRSLVPENSPEPR